jgi:hypothetical protein
LTADINYNSNNNNNTSVTDRNIYNRNFSEKYLPVFQKSLGEGNTKNFIAQTDYSNPFTDNQKFEAGVRASIRDVNTSNDQFTYDHSSYRYIQNQNVSNSYNYSDAVYAAYGTYSLKLKKWSYQFGLRVESSRYDGTDLKNDTSFKIDYPFSIFPSIFATYELSDKDDLQFNASRRINRPNFFQLLPFTDISDPQNVSRGNPD